jgi:drug/metabolite transporter (DMT)-like permease
LILIWAILDEVIRGSTLVGLAMILAGLAMQHWRRPPNSSI